MRVLRRENGTFLLENDHYNIRIIYFGENYEQAFAAGELSAEDVFVSFFPKKETPFSICFILESSITDQEICIDFTDLYYVEQTKLDSLCDAIAVANATISDTIDAMNEYFPGILAEECQNGI